MSKSSEALAEVKTTRQTFQQSQLDKYDRMVEAQEKMKAFENGLAIATSLTKALIEAGELKGGNNQDVLNNLKDLLEGTSEIVESKLRSLRQLTEEALVSPDVPQSPANGNA